MDPFAYEQRRDKLVEIINEILALSDIAEAPCSQLKEIATRLCENQYEIVIVGEFQGGKSTTFNALCDGREISARGAGIKTTACAVSAQNLADPDVQEHAEVRWRTKGDLVLGFANLIHGPLRALAPERFLSATSDEIAETLDLDNENDWDLARKALDQLWEEWKADKVRFSQRGILDALRVATLAVHFYRQHRDSERPLREKLSLQQGTQLISFPSNWESRWRRGRPSEFKFNESGLAFVGHVDFFIHSKNLGRLGCAITDSPGLFASRWDTRVAQDAMLRADAILYLLRGDKAVSASDLQALQEIHQAGMDHKVRYAINLRRGNKEVVEQLLSQDASAIGDLGLKVTPSDIRPYHALLALCAASGKAFLHGTLDQSSQERFLAVAGRFGPSGDFPKAWAQTVRDALQVLGSPKRDEQLQEIDERAVVLASEESSFETLLLDLEQFILHERAYGALVISGAQRALEVLRSYEGALTAREISLHKSEEEIKVSLAAAENELDDFQREAKEIIKPLQSGERDKLLADAMDEEAILSNIPRIIKRFVTSLTHEGGKFGKSVRGDRTHDELMPFLNEAYVETVMPLLRKWFALALQGKDETFNKHLLSRVVDVQCALARRWGRMPDTDYSKLLEGLALPTTEGVLDRDAERMDSFLRDARVIEGAAQKAKRRDMIATVASLITGSAAATAALQVLTLATVPVFGAILVSGVLGGLLGDWLKGRVDDYNEQRVASDLEAHLETCLTQTEIQNDRRKALEERIIAVLRRRYVDFYETAIEAQKTRFERRAQDISQQFRDTRSDRDRAAENARLLRTVRIQPLRRRLEEFCREVSAIARA